MSMGLIDKDKIKYLSIPIAPVLVGENVHYEMGALKEWIDDMPTVEAIPLDKVEQILEKYKLRIPPTVYYDLLADVRNYEVEQ